MHTPDGPDPRLEAARSALEAGDDAVAAALYVELADIRAVPEEDLVRAARVILAHGGEEGAPRAEGLLAAVTDQDPAFAEALGLRARLLEDRNGASPAEAVARALAHMQAAVAGAEPRDRFLKDMFRALVRAAELEAGIPDLDPGIPGAEAVTEALRAHRRWRQGGSAAAAARAYQAAREAAPPDVLVPYLLFWTGHLQGVAEQLDEALATYHELLEVGPPGRRGREDVEARIRHFEARRAEAAAAEAPGPDAPGVVEQVESLRAEGRPEEAVVLLEGRLRECQDRGDELDLRRLLARTLTVMGARDRAHQEWERIHQLQRGEDPDEDPVGGRGGEEAHEAPATVEVEWHAEGEGPEPTAQEVVLPRVVDDEVLRDRARHQAALAQRLDDAGRVRDAVMSLRESYQDLPPGHEQDRLRKRAGALSWHRLRDPLLALEALGGLTDEARSSPDVRRLEEGLRDGVVDRFRREIELGLRRDAFVALSALVSHLDRDEPLYAQLVQLHLDELSSCVNKRWTLRRRELAAQLEGYASRGVGAWDLVRLPDQAEGSPVHLKALREELALLDQMGEGLRRRELRALAERDVDGVARRWDDREGLMGTEALLAFAGEVAARTATREDSQPVEGWKDRLVSWLPRGARDALMSRAGRSVDSALEDLQGQFEAFLDLRYGLE